MLQRRTKLISIRTSKEEYEHICAASVNHGFRTVSEFARAALIGWVSQFQLGSSKDTEMECLCSRLKALETKIVQIEAERDQTTHQ